MDLFQLYACAKAGPLSLVATLLAAGASDLKYVAHWFSREETSIVASHTEAITATATQAVTIPVAPQRE